VGTDEKKMIAQVRIGNIDKSDNWMIRHYFSVCTGRSWKL